MPEGVVLLPTEYLRYLGQLRLELLETHDIGPLALHPLVQLGGTRANAVDVPGGEFHNGILRDARLLGFAQTCRSVSNGIAWRSSLEDESVCCPAAARALSTGGPYDHGPRLASDAHSRTHHASGLGLLGIEGLIERRRNGAVHRTRQRFPFMRRAPSAHG